MIYRMPTDFKLGDRVLAPHPEDPNGTPRRAKIASPGNDMPGTQVSVDFEDGRGMVNVAGDRVVALS
jgi:hypothetical protein